MQPHDEVPSQIPSQDPAQPLARDPAEPLARDPAEPLARDPAEPLRRDPAEPLARDPAEPLAEPVPADIVVIDEETPSGDADVAPQAAGRDPQWSEILATFVDDPRGSVQRAGALIDQAIEDLVASLRQRQASLASAWQDADAGTEALRGALQDYRAFWAVLPDTPATSSRPGPGHGSLRLDPDGAAAPDDPGQARTSA